MDLEDATRADFRAGKLSLSDIAVRSIDRSFDEELIYEAQYSVNKVPTLTKYNSYLVVLSVGDIINRVEDGAKQYFRFITGPERLILQGFPAEVALRLPENKLVFASGNSYPTPLIVATFYPMLKAIVDSGFNFAQHPQPHTLPSVEPDNVKKLLNALAAPGRVVNKAKHQRYLKDTKKRKRQKDSDSAS